MGKKEICELTNMCMIYNGDKILVENKTDPNWGGVSFPGGHVEKGESFVESVIREVKEETGLTVSNIRLCGIKQWVNKADDSRYIVLFFKTNSYSGELKSSAEGDVFWIDKHELNKYKLADSFEYMFKVFDNDNLSETISRYYNEQWNIEIK